MRRSVVALTIISSTFIGNVQVTMKGNWLDRLKMVLWIQNDVILSNALLLANTISF